MSAIKVPGTQSSIFPSEDFRGSSSSGNTVYDVPFDVWEKILQLLIFFRPKTILETNYKQFKHILKLRLVNSYFTDMVQHSSLGFHWRVHEVGDIEGNVLEKLWPSQSIISNEQ